MGIKATIIGSWKVYVELRVEAVDLGLNLYAKAVRGYSGTSHACKQVGRFLELRA